MATIDVDKLRDYMVDYAGTAAFNGFPSAFLDIMDVQNMDPCELCREAEDLGIDLNKFKVDER